MKAAGFRGGVHPEGNKSWTEHKTIRTAPLPPKVVIPLQQHTGAPCAALVTAGEVVQAGQKIGESGSPVSAPIHASISGLVTAVEPAVHPVLPSPVQAVTIEAKAEAELPAPALGGSDPWSGSADWRALQPEEIRQRIKEAGIVGLGGAAFPTHVKLSPPKGKPLTALIVNGVECEPYLTSDHRLMLEHPEQILEGVRILQRVLGLQKAYFCIETNKPDAIRLLHELARREAGGIEIVAVRVKYPQGAEKQLIKTVLGREVPSGGLPFDVGALVQNAGTAFAVYEAVVHSKPLIERVVTVSGDGIREPQNLRARIGTLFSQLIDCCGGFSTDGAVKLIMGGPMMGIAQYTAEVPVIKGTSGILVLRHPGGQQRETPCIRCGRCLEVCPMSLAPYRLADYAGKEDFKACADLGVRDCIECGACAYACGSRRPIVHLVKYAKMNLARKK